MLNFVLNIQKLLKNLNNLPKNITSTKIKEVPRKASISEGGGMKRDAMGRLHLKKGRFEASFLPIYRGV